MISEGFLAFLLTILLILFFSVHLFMDVRTKGKSILTRSSGRGKDIGSRYVILGIMVSTFAFWVVFLATPFLILFGVYGKIYTLLTLPLFKTCLYQVIGSSLMLLGVIMADWGRLSRGRMAPSTLDVPEDFTFTRHGAYAVVRHPMYLSYYLMFAGLFLLTANDILILCILGYPSYYLMARREEALLKERFPECEGYNKKVGMFFPRLS
jgi:protein-S-isoprenylcysteine O-methyltransferase Ste14